MKRRSAYLLATIGALATLASAAPLTQLKAVPYLGAEEPYFLGSGVAGAGGNTHGDWDFLIGPDYTSPNFISKETLSVIIDGKIVELHPQMHRAQGAGIFFGTERIRDCDVSVIDFTNAGMPSVVRIIRVINRSRSRAVDIGFQANITPSQAKGLTSGKEHSSSIRIVADQSSFCFGGETKNWATRSSLITFDVPCDATQQGNSWVISTHTIQVRPNQFASTGLFHAQTYDADVPRHDRFAWRGPEQSLAQSVREWSRWLASGKRLKIPDSKARDIVEGSLIACKMQQDRDGGMIAGPRKYANSYIRDSHGGLRLFLATGHVAEAKKIIDTIHHKWKIAGFIPNYWSMGSDSFIGRSFVNDSSEITGYYVLMIRDTYAATKDIGYVDTVADAMKYAVDAQLDFMEKHSWRITFNGDETEQYCDKVDGQEYGGFPAFQEWRRTNWSFPSAALVCASTQFYIDYLELKGRHAEAARYRAKLQSVKDGTDATFLRNGVHAWMRTKEDTWPLETVTNYDLIPLWIGARLNGDRQMSDALAMRASVDAKTGFLPTAPPAVTGFCGHNLGYLLYDLSALHDPMAPKVFRTMMDSSLYGCWGTVSEFYGPGGVPNGHNFRVFESGIDGEAITRYFENGRV